MSAKLTTAKLTTRKCVVSHNSVFLQLNDRSLEVFTQKLDAVETGF